MGKAKLHYPKGGLCQVTHLLPFVLYVYCIVFLGQWEKLNCTILKADYVKSRICCLLYCTFIASDF